MVTHPSIEQTNHYLTSMIKQELLVSVDYKFNQAIGLISRVFANGPGDQGSIPCSVIPKTQKLVLDAALLSSQDYKVTIKGKVDQSRK